MPPTSDDVSDEALGKLVDELPVVLQCSEILDFAKRIRDLTAQRCIGVAEKMKDERVDHRWPEQGEMYADEFATDLLAELHALFPSSSASPTTEEVGRG